MVRIIDAEGATLGRLCTAVAKNLLDGDEIALINVEKAVISGKKFKIKEQYKEKREVGTYRKGPFFHRSPDKMVKRSVRGMLPYQTPHGRAALKRLKCYIGIPDQFKGKDAESIPNSKKHHIDYITIQELSRSLGAKI
jgi:large subunit ribosomal protein L13